MSIMLKMMGLYVKTEYHTSRGRIDIVFDIYIIELKRDLDPHAALQQIEEKGYSKPFLASGKQIIKLLLPEELYPRKYRQIFTKLFFNAY